MKKKAKAGKSGKRAKVKDLSAKKASAVKGGVINGGVTTIKFYQK
jgi:hypothetical protein